MLDDAITPFLLMSKLSLEEINNLISVIKLLMMESVKVFIIRGTCMELPWSVLYYRVLEPEGNLEIIWLNTFYYSGEKN